ncbi:alginate lyase, partial [Clostridioides difficile]
FEPGDYYWRYALLVDHPVQQDSESEADGVSQAKQGSEAEGHASQGKQGEVSAWSEVRRFTVPVGLPETPLPSRAQRYVSTDTSHPRLWL